jgi:hypothetical protein
MAVAITIFTEVGLGCGSESAPSADIAPDSGAPDGSGGSSNADAGGVDASRSCPTPTGPTVHGITAATETWTAVGSPHIIPGDLTVLGQLTLEPCAEVLIAAGKVVTIQGPAGALIANGTATQPIHIGPKEAGQPFGKLAAANNGAMRLGYVNIDGGGGVDASSAPPPAEIGTLDITASGSATHNDLLFVDHVQVEGSAANGVVLRGGANFAPGSGDLVIHGSALYPMRLAVNGLGGLPAGVYTGNTKDEIGVVANERNSVPFRETTTLRDLGVPYHVLKNSSSAFSGELLLSAATPGGNTTLTIEPGVTMRFDQGGALRVADALDEGMQSPATANATLIAVGTAAKPIVFTSAQAAPLAGDWIGLSFAAIPQPLSRLAFVRVEYAGRAAYEAPASCVPVGGASPAAAIRLHGSPATQFITDTTIANSSSNGIDRSYRTDTPVDFLFSNTFTAIVACNETFPPSALNVCPATVPCPK